MGFYVWGWHKCLKGVAVARQHWLPCAISQTWRDCSCGWMLITCSIDCLAAFELWFWNHHDQQIYDVLSVIPVSKATSRVWPFTWCSILQMTCQNQMDFYLLRKSLHSLLTPKQLSSLANFCSSAELELASALFCSLFQFLINPNAQHTAVCPWRDQ